MEKMLSDRIKELGCTKKNNQESGWTEQDGHWRQLVVHREDRYNRRK